MNVSTAAPRGVEAEIERLRRENSALREVLTCIINYPVGFDWDAARVMQAWARTALAAIQEASETT